MQLNSIIVNMSYLKNKFNLMSAPSLNNSCIRPWYIIIIIIQYERSNGMKH